MLPSCLNLKRKRDDRNSDTARRKDQTFKIHFRKWEGIEQGRSNKEYVFQTYMKRLPATAITKDWRFHPLGNPNLDIGVNRGNRGVGPRQVIEFMTQR